MTSLFLTPWNGFTPIIRISQVHTPQIGRSKKTKIKKSRGSWSNRRIAADYINQYCAAGAGVFDTAPAPGRQTRKKQQFFG
jgi:hypothetical protein